MWWWRRWREKIWSFKTFWKYEYLLDFFI